MIGTHSSSNFFRFGFFESCYDSSLSSTSPEITDNCFQVLFKTVSNRGIHLTYSYITWNLFSKKFDFGEWKETVTRTSTLFFNFLELSPYVSRSLPRVTGQRLRIQPTPGTYFGSVTPFRLGKLFDSCRP